MQHTLNVASLIIIYYDVCTVDDTLKHYETTTGLVPKFFSNHDAVCKAKCAEVIYSTVIQLKAEALQNRIYLFHCTNGL